MQVDWGKARAVVEAVGLTDRNQRYDFHNLFFAQAGLIFERHTVMNHQLEKSLDNKARRYAKRVGLYAKKWRGSLGTSLNNGGFMLLEPNSNRVVAGEYFNLTAVDVMAICEGQR